MTATRTMASRALNDRPRANHPMRRKSVGYTM